MGRVAFAARCAYRALRGRPIGEVKIEGTVQIVGDVTVSRGVELRMTGEPTVGGCLLTIDPPIRRNGRRLRPLVAAPRRDTISDDACMGAVPPRFEASSWVNFRRIA